MHLELSLRSWQLVSGELHKIRNLEGLTLEPAIRSCDTRFDTCEVTTTWKCNIRLQAPPLAKKCDISHWLLCGADDGQTSYHATTKIPRMDRQPNFVAMGLRFQHRKENFFHQK